MCRCPSRRPSRPSLRSNLLNTVPTLKFKMKLICFASLLASATAFTSTGAAFTTQSFNVGERSVNVAAGPAHRTRKATIVMDGKANGTYDIYVCVCATNSCNTENQSNQKGDKVSIDAFIYNERTASRSLGRFSTDQKALRQLAPLMMCPI